MPSLSRDRHYGERNCDRRVRRPTGIDHLRHVTNCAPFSMTPSRAADRGTAAKLARQNPLTRLRRQHARLASAQGSTIGASSPPVTASVSLPGAGTRRWSGWIRHAASSGSRTLPPDNQKPRHLIHKASLAAMPARSPLSVLSSSESSESHEGWARRAAAEPPVNPGGGSLLVRGPLWGPGWT